MLLLKFILSFIKKVASISFKDYSTMVDIKTAWEIFNSNFFPASIAVPHIM